MSERALTKLSEKGRLVIPAPIREALGLEVGDLLNLRVVDGELRITSFHNNLLRAQERLKKYVTPGTSVVDEFLAEKRQEVAREEEAAQRWINKKKRRVG